jgi:transketolase
MLDNVLVAVEGLDVTVLYTATVRPFDAASLRAASATRDRADVVVVLVDPCLAGTSTAAAGDALADTPHRVLGLGTARRELRRYGSIKEHLAAHGLDPRGLRERITGFLARRSAA